MANVNIEEVTKENEELKGLLQYYYGAEKLLERADEILERALEGEIEVCNKADEIDDIAFKKENELQRREIKLEEQEKETKRLLSEAQKKYKEASSYIEKKAAKKIKEQRRIYIYIMIGITILYSIITFVIYLNA